MQIRVSLDILLRFKFFEILCGKADRLASRESKADMNSPSRHQVAWIIPFVLEVTEVRDMTLKPLLLRRLARHERTGQFWNGRHDCRQGRATN